MDFAKSKTFLRRRKRNASAIHVPVGRIPEEISASAYFSPRATGEIATFSPSVARSYAQVILDHSSRPGLALSHMSPVDPVLRAHHMWMADGGMPFLSLHVEWKSKFAVCPKRREGKTGRPLELT